MKKNKFFFTTLLTFGCTVPLFSLTSCSYDYNWGWIKETEFKIHPDYSSNVYNFWKNGVKVGSIRNESNVFILCDGRNREGKETDPILLYISINDLENQFPGHHFGDLTISNYSLTFKLMRAENLENAYNYVIKTIYN